VFSDWFSTTGFDLSGRPMSFGIANGYGTVDDFKVKSYSGSAFDVVETYEPFTVNGSTGRIGRAMR
jgi:hypothetical protein